MFPAPNFLSRHLDPRQGECAVTSTHAASLRMPASHHFLSFLSFFSGFSAFFSPESVTVISGAVSVWGLYEEISLLFVVEDVAGKLTAPAPQVSPWVLAQA